MKYSVAFLMLIAVGPAYGAGMGPAFSGLYTVTDLGSVTGVPAPYSSLIFEAGNPNVLLLGGAATKSTGELYSVPVTRSAITNEVTGLGAPTPFASTPYIDGGLLYAPNGDLLFTTYSSDQVSEIKPGHTSPDKTVAAPTSQSTGSFQIVPSGFSGAGNLIVDSVGSSEICLSSLSADGFGTYNVGGCSATLTGSGGTEGIVYVPQGAQGFSGEIMLIAEYSGNQVVAYAVASNGLPILSSAQTFVSNLGGVQGATIDPVTGDFFFSTFSGNGVNEVYKVSPIAPAPTPAITAVSNAASSGTTLCPGLMATVHGSNFGTDAGKASVMVGGNAAYVYPNGFTASQMTVQLPFGSPPGPTTISVTISGSPSSPFPITLSATSPAFQTQITAPTLAQVTNSAGTAPITLFAPAHPGDTVIAEVVGLGVTNPPTPTGAVAAGVTNQVSPLPTITVGGVAATVVSAGVTSTTPPGVYLVKFTLPPNIQGTDSVVITAGGQSSPAVIGIAVAGISSVVNSGSFANPGTIAPGSIASVFANGLGNAAANESSGVFPSTLSEGAQVTFNGIAAPLFNLFPAPAMPAISPQQIDLFIPSELPTSGAVTVQLQTSSGLYPNYTLNMVPASPGFYRFTDPQTGNQFVIAQFANTLWLALPVSTTANLGLPACTSATSALTACGEPAKIGDILQIYLTGLGLATANGGPNGAPLPTGQVPPADGSVLYETPTLPTVTIGGIPATVLFSGLVPGIAGEYQLDVQVPSGVANGDNVPVKVTMMGASDTTAISIQSNSISPP